VEIDNVIGKIRKLCTRTVERGCTEAEALTAAERIGELMAVYNITIDKVFLDQQSCIQKAVPTTRKVRSPIDRCVPAIAKMCDCRVWFDKWNTSVASYIFFGMETDVEMACYLYANLLVAVQNETDRFKKTKMYDTSFVHGKRLTTSFQRGMVNRISSRLNIMTAARKRTEDKPIPAPIAAFSATSMVHLKQNKVESEFEKMGFKLGKCHGPRQGIGHYDAYHQGRDAGDRVNLNRPIGNGSNLAGLLD
jgi:hypothetical protein